MKFTMLIIAFSAYFIGCNSGGNRTWEYKVLYADGTSVKGAKNLPVGITDLGSEDLTYSKEIYVSEKALNELGANGWELVNSYLENETVFPGLRELLASDGLVPKPHSNVRPRRLVLIFKRAK